MFIYVLLLTLLLIISVKTEKISRPQFYIDHLARVTIDQMIYDGEIQDAMTHVKLDTYEALMERMKARS